MNGTTSRVGRTKVVRTNAVAAQTNSMENRLTLRLVHKNRPQCRHHEGLLDTAYVVK